MYQIGQVAKLFRVSRRTLRRYEQRGLLPPAKRSVGGFRLYNETSLSRLHAIQAARHIGFSLAEVQSLLLMRDRGLKPCGQVRLQLARKLASVRIGLGVLEELQAVLEDRLVRMEACLAADDGFGAGDSGKRDPADDEKGKEVEAMATTKFSIKGMTCSHCAMTIEGALSKVDGVEKARVNYLKKEAEVRGTIETATLIKAVEQVGYQAIPRESGDA